SLSPGRFDLWREGIRRKFAQGFNKVMADNLVVVRLHIQAGVLLRNALYRRCQHLGGFDIFGVGGKRTEQRKLLATGMLVAHVENVFQFRIMAEHALVEMLGNDSASAFQQGNGDRKSTRLNSSHVKISY